MKRIRNGLAYPLTLKNAALNTWKDTNKSGAKIAKEFNISTGILAKWVSDAGLQRNTNPNLTASVHARVALIARQKAFNTPTVQLDGTIMYQGRIYK